MESPSHPRIRVTKSNPRIRVTNRSRIERVQSRSRIEEDRSHKTGGGPPQIMSPPPPHTGPRSGADNIPSPPPRQSSWRTARESRAQPPPHPRDETASHRMKRVQRRSRIDEDRGVGTCWTKTKPFTHSRGSSDRAVGSRALRSLPTARSEDGASTTCESHSKSRAQPPPHPRDEIAERVQRRPRIDEDRGVARLLRILFPVVKVHDVPHLLTATVDVPGGTVIKVDDVSHLLAATVDVPGRENNCGV